jgi:hypothetical protein
MKLAEPASVLGALGALGVNPAKKTSKDLRRNMDTLRLLKKAMGKITMVKFRNSS